MIHTHKKALNLTQTLFGDDSFIWKKKKEKEKDYFFFCILRR